MTEELRHPSRSLPLDRDDIYKIIGQDEKPITVYAESAKDKGQFTWYRVPSWPVVFLGFEEFDLRVHKHLSGNGWVVAEATTGKSVQADTTAETSDGPCVMVAWQITKGNITPEKMRDAIAKAHVHLKEIGAVPSEIDATDAARYRFVANHGFLDGLLEGFLANADRDEAGECNTPEYKALTDEAVDHYMKGGT